MNSPQLQQLIGEVEISSRNARAMFDRTRKEQLLHRPQNQWSANDCIRHLTLSTDLYLSALPPILDKARTDGILGDGPFAMDLKGKLLKWFLEPPYRVRAKTLTSLEQTTDEDPATVLQQFLESQEKLMQLMVSADGIALDKVVITSPFNGSLRYNLYSCFSVLLAHQRRHLWQAERAIPERSGVRN